MHQLSKPLSVHSLAALTYLKKIQNQRTASYIDFKNFKESLGVMKELAVF